jgi:hypothetical protein
MRKSRKILLTTGSNIYYLSFSWLPISALKDVSFSSIMPVAFLENQTFLAHIDVIADFTRMRRYEIGLAAV